jgi:hypothetical protein
LFSEEIISRSYEGRYLDAGNATFPLLKWFEVEVFMSLAPTRPLMTSHRGCQFSSSSLRFMLSFVWFLGLKPDQALSTSM